MGFTKITAEVKNISALPDKVNNQALWLKGKFDQAGETIKTAVNGLVDELASKTAGESIGVDIASVTSKTLQAVLEAFEVAIADRYTKTEADTLVSSEVNSLVADVDVNLTTGVITVTKKDGTSETFDTALEKVPATFTIVESSGTYYLKITNVDGSSTQTDITSLMNIYKFDSNDEVAFSTLGEGYEKTITASIRANSIGLDKLSLTAVSTIEGYKNSAADSASAAALSATSAENSATTATEKAEIATASAENATSKANEAIASANSASESATIASSKATLAESWAVGGTNTRTGEDTNNAKYWAEQAKGSAKAAALFVNMTADSTVTSGYVLDKSALEIYNTFITEGRAVYIVYNSSGLVFEVPLVRIRQTTDSDIFYFQQVVDGWGCSIILTSVDGVDSLNVHWNYLRYKNINEDTSELVFSAENWATIKNYFARINGSFSGFISLVMPDTTIYKSADGVETDLSENLRGKRVFCEFATGTNEKITFTVTDAARSSDYQRYSIIFSYATRTKKLTYTEELIPIVKFANTTEFTPTGDYNLATKKYVDTSSVPTGLICMWSGATIPSGWNLCDGTNGTPDLRDKFIVGSGSAYAIGDTGGADSVTLTLSQIPSHRHAYKQITSESRYPGTSSAKSYAVVGSSSNYTEYNGGGEAHENRPPYYALAYIMKA